MTCYCIRDENSILVNYCGQLRSFYCELVSDLIWLPLQLFYDLDTELTYSCLPGFKRKGFQEAQCFFYNDSARWFGPDLQCLPIDCGPPEEILNGERVGECTTYRCQVRLLCKQKITLILLCLSRVREGMLIS